MDFSQLTKSHIITILSPKLPAVSSSISMQPGPTNLPLICAPTHPEFIISDLSADNNRPGWWW
jgi:hypothetical protein